MVQGIIEHTEGASHDEQEGLAISLEKEIENLKELSSEACIFNVHEELRRTKPEAYTPLLISIGPYHHGDPKFSKMEELKLRYLKSFLRRGEGVITMEQCCNKLKGLKERAERYYVDDIKLSDNELVKMLLLDGCFIVEFFVREDPSYGQEGQKEERDTFFMPSGMVLQVLLDLLLLENQLPFFVLQQVYDMIYHDKRVTFLDYVQLNLVRINHRIPIRDYIEDNAEDIKHLLQVVHILCNPQNIGTTQCQDETFMTKLKVMASKIAECWTRSFKSPNNTQQERVTASNSSIADCWTQPSKSPPNTQQERDYWTTCFPACSSSKQSQDSENIESVRTASELQEAGVHIKKVEKAPSLFHIKFNNGKLEIPSLHISDLTETYFRNIIAYEQHSCGLRGNKYFTDYAKFMDTLINTEKDVVLFRKKGVFINSLGDDKEVTDLFNQLCKGVVWSSSEDYYYAGVSNDLDRHYNKPWNVLKAKLRHDYFHTPWAGVSTIAAIVLLLLTITQTVIAFLDLPSGKK